MDNKQFSSGDMVGGILIAVVIAVLTVGYVSTRSAYIDSKQENAMQGQRLDGIREGALLYRR